MENSTTSIFRGRQVLFLSSIDWSATWQRHQAWAEAFNAAGAEVFFVENTGFRGFEAKDFPRILGRLRRLFSSSIATTNAPPGTKSASGCRIITPVVLPPNGRVSRRFNSAIFVPRLMRRLRETGLKEKPLVFAYLPTPTTLQIIDSVTPDIVVYDCVDNFSGHPCAPADLAATEKKLLEKSALVLTTSRYLYEVKSAQHFNVLELHHGVSLDFFTGTPRPQKVYKKLCYFGTVWNALDYAPIRALADAGYEVTLIGPVKEPPPPLPPSVRFLGPLPHEALPKKLAEFDALLLPYADSPYNLGVTPAKIYECLATGKPILASSIYSLLPHKDSVYLAGSPEDFVQIVPNLPKTENESRIAARITTAREHTTQMQFRTLESALAKALSHRA